MTPGPWLEVDLGPGVRAGFTTTGLGNLSTALEDDAAAVTGRRATLEGLLGSPVAWLRQVHGNAVHVATAPGPDCADADAAIATAAAPGVAVAVLVADCVPVLLADPGAGVVVAVHAGRRGVLARVVEAAVVRATAAGARPDVLAAVIGPAICGECYEVPAQLREEAVRLLPDVPQIAATTSWGTPALDLPAAVAAQLHAAGVARVTTVARCTRTDPAFFSHRAAGEPGGRAAGRFAGAVAAAPTT